MTKVKVLFSTINSREQARKIARRLVEEQLAACVNIVPEVVSVYKWKGQMEEEREFLLIIKTSHERLPLLLNRLRELHPYEVPEAVALAVESGLKDYLDWVVSG